MEARTFVDKKKSFKMEKKEAVQIAKDLCYPMAVIENIKNALCSDEITRILCRARLA